MRSTLPSTSPTTRSSCAAARRRRGTGPGYATLRAWPAGVQLLETADVVAAIERSADARTARMLLTRAVEAHPDLAAELVERPLVRDGLVALACASRSLSSAVVADATLLDPLRDPDEFARERSVETYRLAWHAQEGDDGTLRRWKRRELLRIAVRDLLGAADMPGCGP